MDRLQAMETFVRVVETGSFSAVARERRSTQSAISKQVAGLESALGARLLSRSTRSLALTDEGSRYFEKAQRLVAEIAEAETSLRQGEESLRGWLRIAASVAYGRLQLLPIVQRFLAEHPQVRIDMQLADGFVDLVEQGIDVAVRVGELADSSLIARRVGTTRRVVVANRSYLRNLPAGLARPREPRDLLQHSCILYTELRAGNAWHFTAGPGASAAPGTAETVRVQGNLQSNSSEIIRGSVLAGLGLGYTPSWMFEDELASGEVEIVLPDWQSPDVPIQLVSPPQRRQSAKVRAFGDAVAAALGD